MRPTVFIGSSSEALPIAEAIHSRLKNDSVVVLWDTTDIFTPTEATLTALTEALTNFDFAIFVISADDVTVSRALEAPSPRDNVIFELGLFMGSIGYRRSFIAYDQRSKPKLPSDLTGITYLPYNSSGYSDLSAAVVGVTTPIKHRMRELGVRRERFVRPPVAYWCGPHADRSNRDVKAGLERFAIEVRLPDEIVVGLDPALDPAGRAAGIRVICCDAIKESDVVIVNLDSYGLDSAWEMGFAEALGIPIIGYNRSDELLDVKRVVNKWRYSDNFMHGWDDATVSPNLDEIAAVCRDRVVYLFCPYRNTDAIAAIEASDVARSARRLVISNRDLGIDPAAPSSYSWRVRKRAIQLLNEAEIVLAILPRYGMDTAWKLGYAAALGKMQVGWLTDDFGTEQSNADFLDHWMHGWRKKPVVSSIHDLATFVRGLPLDTTRS